VVTLIVQGDQGGILINGRPAGYAQDEQFWGNEIHLRIGSTDQVTPIQFDIDNFKFWDLDPVEEKEFTKPLLLALNNNLLFTYGDNFSDLKPEWGRLPNGVSIADGALVMEASNDQDVTLASNLFAARDFAIRIQFTVTSTGEGIEIGFGFRGANEGYHFVLRPDLPLRDWIIYKSEEIFLQGQAPMYLPGKTNELICLAQGDQFAIYLNELPLSLFKDGAYTGKQNQIQISVKSGTAKLLLDELIFIDLSKMQIP